ncbi:MAG: SGNH/GDSL hydrolase family protein [Candidatus Woesearchaeota archaeon]
MKSIIVFGDSITKGRGATIGWCDRLKEHYESLDYYNCLYNLGIPGDNTKDVITRLDIEARARAQYHYDDDTHTIILAIGINDSRLNNGIPETDVKEFRNNIRDIISITKKYTPNIAFIGLIPVDENITADYEGTSFSNERITEYDNIIKEECAKENIPYCNVYDDMILKDYTKLLGDGLHPNDKGHEIIYNIILEFLKANIIVM